MADNDREGLDYALLPFILLMTISFPLLVAPFWLLGRLLEVTFGKRIWRFVGW